MDSIKLKKSIKKLRNIIKDSKNHYSQCMNKLLSIYKNRDKKQKILSRKL